ncbi:MAG: trypsin-like peptidase domain-containing protein [Oscillospiraceae bacterium]|nr:trypsin-like peptidase domain-containing protein [Oscillospiraceae bacterium]
MIYNNNNENENKDIYNAPENSYSYSSDTENTEKPHKKRSFLKAVAFILSLVIVGAGSVQVYKYTEKNPKISTIENDSSEESENSEESEESESINAVGNTNPTSSESEQLPSLIDLASRKNAISVPDIVENSMPSVVGVSATFEYTQQSIDIWGFGTPSNQTREIKGTGTGIIMTDDGYIITNAHVVYDTSEYNCGDAKSVSVVLSDETEYEAKVMGRDVETDIAVLKIDAKNLKAAEFGDSNDLKVGELVIAIGNPLGFELFGSVTSGIISAIDREITVNEKQMKLIQTDAAINSGNSGGPLLNSCGQVIGINSSKISSSYGSASIEGLGFAIPISEAKIIIDDLINYGYVTGRPQIGIQTQNVSDTISRFYGIPVGVYVVSVSEGSSAEFAGIKEGDVIIGIQGEPVENLNELNEIKNKYKAGDEIKLTISRQGESEDIEISLVLQEVTPDKE